MSKGWSHLEVEATVESYFQMLSAELRGQPYSKAKHRRQLLPLLNNRTEGAIELKHGNISAILIELGFPWIGGYKPFSNYQDLLRQVVVDRLSANPQIGTLADEDANKLIIAPSIKNILESLSDPPRRRNRIMQVSEPAAAVRQGSPWQKVNYLEKEARNARLGRSGEEFVMKFEEARLINAGREKLAERVEHVSVTRGDGGGFDILSFEDTGAERFIEVKTTKYGRETPFFVTRKEVNVSHDFSNEYHLYRVFQFRDAPKLYTLKGAIADNCALEPTSYVARVG